MLLCVLVHVSCVRREQHLLPGHDQLLLNQQHSCSLTIVLQRKFCVLCARDCPEKLPLTLCSCFAQPPHAKCTAVYQSQLIAGVLHKRRIAATTKIAL